MKRIILFLFLFFNIMPVIENGKLTINGPVSCMAQILGTEEDTDQCDESAPNYDPSLCEMATCDPNSVNYVPDECEGQACDPSSINYDPETCDGDPGSGDPGSGGSGGDSRGGSGYDPQQDQCDPSSSNYNDTVCELSTCDPSSVNYDVDECDAQVCDDSSINFDPSECEIVTCDPDNVNYDVDECDAQACDDSSINFDPSECEIETCDPDNVNYDPKECAAQNCDPTSINYSAKICEICDAIKKLKGQAATDLLTNPGIAPTLHTVRTNWSVSGSEQGFAIGDRNGPYNIAYGIETSNNAYEVDFSYCNYTSATAHTHQTGNPHSAGDIYSLAKESGKYPLLTQGMYVIGGSASYDFYLSVANPAQLAKFNSSFPQSTFYDPASHGFISSTSIGIAYKDALNYFIDQKPGINDINTIVRAEAMAKALVDSRPEALAYILDKYNTGLVLYRRDKNGNFTPIVSSKDYLVQAYLSSLCN